MRTVDRGDASEANVIAQLKDIGLSVSIPWGDNQKYDCIVDDGENLHRVQIKTARKRNGCIIFECRGSRMNSQCHRTINYTDEDIDAYIAYYPPTEMSYWVSIEEGTSTQKRLRVDEAESNDPRICCAEEYLLTERFK